MEMTYLLNEFNQSIDAMVKAIKDVDYNCNNIQSMTGKGEENIQLLIYSNYNRYI